MRKSKYSTRNRNFKRKRTHSICVGTSDLSNDTKNHTTKSRETIPLKAILARIHSQFESLEPAFIVNLKASDLLGNTTKAPTNIVNS
jgi:hypothetical protein